MKSHNVKISTSSFLSKYHRNFLRELTQKLDVKGKCVLEIGGHTFPAEVLFSQLGVKKWVSVDFTDYWGDNASLEQAAKENKDVFFAKLQDYNADNFASHRYIIYDGDAGLIPSGLDEQFDTVVSLACFEHVQDLDTVVSRIYHCLKPGGEFYTSFSPIWSSPQGHHCNNFMQSVKRGIPRWGHLLNNEKQMRDCFAKGLFRMSEDEFENLIFCSYSPDAPLNRLFFEDYENTFERSEFRKYSIIPSGSNILVKKWYYWQTLAKLRQLYPRYEKFYYGGMKIYAVK